MRRRRSIRRYTAEAVTDEQVRLLLEAAMSAPSGHDRRPCHFVVVRDRETRESLAATHEFSGMLTDSPLVIVVCADQRRSLHWLEDACVAAENLLLSAVAMGLGAAWVAVYPHQEHEQFVQGILDIPAPIRVGCMIPVGYPAEKKPPRTRYDADKVHFERFSSSPTHGKAKGTSQG